MHQSSELETLQTSLTHLVTLLGVILLLGGCVVLAYIGILALEVINNPEEVKIVHYVLEQVQIDHTALSGNVDGQTFEITLGEPLKTAIFLVIGLLTLNFLAKIVKILVLTGLQLIKSSQATLKPKDTKQ